VTALERLKTGSTKWLAATSRAHSCRLLWLGMRTTANRAEQARARHDPRGVDEAVRAADALATRAAATTPNPLHGATPVLASGAVKALFDGERSRLDGRSDAGR
jgi:hypothetical protein